MKPGATGEFPDGKLDPTDEGQLTMAVGIDVNGLVRIDFGKPVAWFSMPAREAVGLAKLLLDHALPLLNPRGNG